jgi:hypothetical protein
MEADRESYDDKYASESLHHRLLMADHRDVNEYRVVANRFMALGPQLESCDMRSTSVAITVATNLNARISIGASQEA